MDDDLRKQIITNKTSERMLDSVSPVYEDSFVGLWLYEVMGKEFQTMWDLMDTIPAQFYPESATWSLPLWERRYLLVTDESLNIETRRERIIEKRNKKNRFNNYRLETWLKEKSGGAVTIIDYIKDFTFAVRIESDTHLLRSFDLEEAKEYINRHKPSHMSYEINFRSNKRLDIYVGIVLYGAQHQNLGTAYAPNFDDENILSDDFGILYDESGVLITD